MYVLLASLACMASCARPDSGLETQAFSRGIGAQTTKLIAGVPVWDDVFDGEGESEDSWWIVRLNSTEAENACGGYTKECYSFGTTVSFAKVRGSLADLEKMFNQAPGAVFYAERDSSVEVPESDWPVDVPVSGSEPSLVDVSGLSGCHEWSTWCRNYPRMLWGIRRIKDNRPVKAGTRGEGVTVYIVDSGVSTMHSEFKHGSVSRVIPTLDMTNGSLVLCNGDKNCAADQNGHGTFVAGVAAGSKVGLATRAKVRSLKVLESDGRGAFSWTLEAIDWIASTETGPAVACLSLGGGG